MSLTAIPGFGLTLPLLPHIANSPQFATSAIAATGDKFAWIGRFWHKARAAKSVRRVGFRFSTVTKAGGSAMTLSLQDVDLAAGPPWRPDGTQDQTVAIANADASFVTNAWYRSGALSADRSVAPGDWLAVVLEYDGSGRLGSDTVSVSGLSVGSIQHNTGVSRQVSGTWAVQAYLANVVLECDDGTFGTLMGAVPCSAVSSTAYNTGSAADELAMEFQVPVEVKCDGFVCGIEPGASADFDVVLYDSGGSAVATVGHDANAVRATGAHCFVFVPLASELTLAANSTYRLSVKPTTANSVRVHYYDVSDAAHFQAFGGEAFKFASRADGGAWATTATRRPWFALSISAVHDGSGGSGLAGAIIGPGSVIRGGF